MTKFTITAAIATIAFAATPAFAQMTDAEKAEAEAQAALMEAPSTEGVVRDEASCTYEGGSVEQLSDGRVCFIPVRGVVANTKIYDGMKLGVIRCEGNGSFPNELVPGGSYCRVYLSEKQAKKTREELEAELARMTEEELGRSN